MRDDLQMATKVLESRMDLIDGCIPALLDSKSIAIAKKERKGFAIAIAALRDAIARLPDPDTGLVNCGCGGTNHAHYYVNSPGWWGIKCNKCGLAVNGYETREEAVRAANIALGYKGASK